MRFDEVYDNKTNNFEWLIRKDQCMHCSDAPCVAICSTGALYQHNDGFVGFDQDSCIGCGYCAKACPFDIPRYEKDAFTGKDKMNKCNFCQDKITNGEQPACVQTCPTNALELTSWDEAVKQAYKRVDQIKDRFPNANVYGDEIMSGTHYIYVLTEKPEAYGLPTNPKTNELVDFRSGVIKPVTEVLMSAAGIGFLANFIVSSTAFNFNGKDEPKDLLKEEKKHE
ncbi:4Fe-4S dicluster domain-containing protein [Tepidibacillus marianensis]|uniref:4Fe-4S dicluster domain-containing protein n=1 Tax=Tepidibacillus marianensis TaxID=3131995 RepID=UPI0030D563AC